MAAFNGRRTAVRHVREFEIVAQKGAGGGVLAVELDAYCAVRPGWKLELACLSHRVAPVNVTMILMVPRYARRGLKKGRGSVKSPEFNTSTRTARDAWLRDGRCAHANRSLDPRARC